MKMAGLSLKFEENIFDLIQKIKLPQHLGSYKTDYCDI